MKKVSTLLFLLIVITACSSPLPSSPLPSSPLPSSPLPPSPCNNTYLERLALFDPFDLGDLLGSIISVWKSERGCKTGFLCENEKWVIYEKGENCEVAFDIEVNGTPERVPIFYIDVETDYVYASDAVNNFGIPNFLMEPQELP